MRILALFMICAALVIISESYLSGRRAAVRAAKRDAALISAVSRGIKEGRGRLSDVLSSDCADILGDPELYALFFGTDGSLRDDIEKRIAESGTVLMPNKAALCDFFKSIRMGDETDKIRDEVCRGAEALAAEHERRERICRTVCASFAASLILLLI